MSFGRSTSGYRPTRRRSSGLRFTPGCGYARSRRSPGATSTSSGTRHPSRRGSRRTAARGTWRSEKSQPRSSPVCGRRILLLRTTSLSDGAARRCATCAEASTRRPGGLEGIQGRERKPRFHDLRKTGATRIEAVSSHAVAKAFLGHADENVTDTYIVPRSRRSAMRSTGRRGRSTARRRRERSRSRSIVHARWHSSPKNRRRVRDDRFEP